MLVFLLQHQELQLLFLFFPPFLRQIFSIIQDKVFLLLWNVLPRYGFLSIFLSYDRAGVCVTAPVFGCAVMNVCTSFYVSNHLLSIQSWDIWSEMFVFVCLWALRWVSYGRHLYSWETAAGETMIFKHYCCLTAQKIILIFMKGYDQTFLLAKDWRPVQDAQCILG